MSHATPPRRHEADYSILQKMNGKNGFPKLKIGIIYSDAHNTRIDEAGFIDDEDLDASCLASSDRDFLQGALDDYNKMFATTYSLDGFDNYYKDISKRMRGEGNNGSLMPQDQCLDLLIVVNMLLTGFDSRILNTLSPYRRSRKKEPLGKAKRAGRGEAGDTAFPPRLSHVD